MKSPNNLRLTIDDLRLSLPKFQVSSFKFQGERFTFRALRPSLLTPRSSFLHWATLVLLITAVFRLVALHSIPPGLSQDEVLDADIAMFIRQGENAFFFRHGYGHEPLYHYWSAPFAPLLGDNMLASRLSAVFLGMILVALTMRWAKREFGTITGLVTGIGLAVSWWPIVFSRIGLRPISEPVMLVLAAWFWPRHAWLAGVFWGLSLYTYTGARVVFLIPVLLAVYAWLKSRRKEGQLPDGGSDELLSYMMRLLRLRGAVVALAVLLLVGLPLYLTLRADPSLDQRVGQLDGPLQALQEGDVRPILQSTAATLGVFSFTGDPRWTYSLPGKPLFGPITAVFFYLGLFIALRHIRQPRYALLLIWLAVTLLPSALSPDAPSTVRLVGAMPVVYVLPGLALQYSVFSTQYSVFRPGTAHWVLFTVYCALLTFSTLRDGFLAWPAAPETHEKYQTVVWEIGRFWQTEPVERTVVADGFFEPIDADSLRRNMGLDVGARWVQTGSQVAGAIVFPAGGGNGRLFIPEFAPPAADLMEAAGINQQPVYRSPSTPSFAVYELPSQPAMPVMSQTVTFGDAITLLGYEVETGDGERPLTLFTYWQVEANLPADLSIFVHLLAGDTLIAQHDGLDAAASTLHPGDAFIQKHNLPLPAEISAGTSYALHLGLYQRQSQRRLFIDGETADFLPLPDVIFDGN